MPTDSDHAKIYKTSSVKRRGSSKLNSNFSPPDASGDPSQAKSTTEEGSIIPSHSINPRTVDPPGKGGVCRNVPRAPTLCHHDKEVIIRTDPGSYKLSYLPQEPSSQDWSAGPNGPTDRKSTQRTAPVPAGDSLTSPETVNRPHMQKLFMPHTKPNKINSGPSSHSYEALGEPSTTSANQPAGHSFSTTGEKVGDASSIPGNTFLPVIDSSVLDQYSDRIRSFWPDTTLQACKAFPNFCNTYTRIKSFCLPNAVGAKITLPSGLNLPALGEIPGRLS